MNQDLIMNKSVLIILLLLPVFLTAENYSFTSDYLSSVMAEGKEITVLEGDVLISSQSKVIEADKVELIGKDFNYFICEGNVAVEDLENDFLLTAPVFHYDNDNKIIRINASSIMEDRKNELIIKCGFMENREEEKIIILQIGVRILKEDLACRSEFAVYYRDENLLELTGLPVVYRKDDVFRASRITVNLDTDEIKMEGEVQGSLLSEDDSPESENKDVSEDKPVSEEKEDPLAPSLPPETEEEEKENTGVLADE